MVEKGVILRWSRCGNYARFRGRRCHYAGGSSVLLGFLRLLRSKEEAFLCDHMLAFGIVRLVLQWLRMVDVHKSESTHRFIY